ncbi:hypothetical protein [Streptomyces scabiei]|uniref:hypothetical protein n=1 Tax=Streptomyces scabiei TaxID=1930 RepID=UPI000A6F12D7|nr:hypothetical protein [Streptomyces scabiei]MDX2835474.1 hypothetical protein [Streptomyces scabiei]MDX3680482.1 hypothetical protein [Streptomyces scabiei]
MADDDAGGRILGFPGLTIPGPVGSGPPAPGAAAPSLAALPTLAPPPSLLVAGNPGLNGGNTGGSSGGNTVSVNADPGMPDNPQGAGIAAMSVVMMAGITVAAMRGAWNVASYLQARHEHHRAIADQARSAADKAALGVEMARQKGRVQPGPEFGRSTRTSGGGGGRTNSGKNSAPGTFRSSGGPKPSGGSGSRTPGKTPGGLSGGRTGTLGSGGRSGGPKGRSGALESSGTKGGGKPGVGGVKTPTTGTKSGSGSSLTGALRDRAAGRIRNGPAPRPGGGRNGTGTLGTSGKSGSGSTTPSSGSKSGRGSGTKTGTTGTGSGKGRTTLPAAVAAGASSRLKKRRKRLSPPVLSTVRKGKGVKGGGKPGSGSGPKRKGKGRVTLPAAIAAESARRLKKRRKRLDPPVLSTVGKGKKNKKSAPAGTAPGTTKVDLTKKPRPTAGAGGTGSTKKVNLTKKPKPTAGSGGTGGSAPKVDLKKKVNLKKKTRRYGRPGGCFPGGKPGPTGPKGPGPKSSGPKSSGPASGTSSRREQWERAGSRRAERASDTKSGTTSGPGPDAGSGGTFGPPPGWGHAQGTTYTVEQAGPARKTNRTKGPATRGRAGLPAGTSRGGTVVTVPVPAKAPNTQYADSELTIFDVIESDADMAEEIMAGVDEARAAAEGCDKMLTKLEALHAKIVDLKVPGVLEGWVLILAEKAVSVKAKAEALAEKLPAASEAIRTAGENAERRHKPLADAVRDAGHTAPAEREYHVE